MDEFNGFITIFQKGVDFIGLYFFDKESPANLNHFESLYKNQYQMIRV